MASEWHYTRDGRQAAAPVSAAQLRLLAASGQLKPSDLVWQDGMPNWMPAHAIKGLFPSGKKLSDSSIVPPASGKPSGERPMRQPAVPFDWANMHPLAVLILTLVSGGVFAAIYAYKICRAYGAAAPLRPVDAAGRKLGRIRHPLAVLALSYLTIGIYFVYWIYRVLRECGVYAGREDFNPRTELNLMLVFPPYVVYVAICKLPDLIRRTQALAGQPETPMLRQTVLFFNPCLFLALPFLGMVYQEALNQTWLNAP